MAKINNEKKGNHEKEQLIDFSKIFSIVWKNWLVMSRDKARMFSLLLFPIVMIAIFGYTSGSLPKYIPAALVDYDNSNMSQMITNQLYSNNMFSIKYRVGSQDEGRALIDQGKIKALFILPKGLEEDILAGRSTSIYSIFDQSDPSVAQMTMASTQVFVQQLSQALLQQKLGALAGSVQDAQQDLASAKRSISVVIYSNDESANAIMDSTYRNEISSASRFSSSLSPAIQAMQNTMGMRIYSDELDNFSAHILASAESKQGATLTQISAYQGFEAVVYGTVQDTSKIYSSAKMISADSALKSNIASAAYNSMNSADSKLSNITSQLSSIPQSQLSLSVIQPYGYNRPNIDFILPAMLAMTIFQGASTGLGRAIAGERRDGSLTRVFMTPTSNTTIIVGTQAFYLLLEIARAFLIIVTAMLLFGVTMKGSFIDMIPVIIIYTLGAVGIGMVFSVIAKTQEQYMAISMLVMMPTMFLSGVFLPIQTMPPVLQSVASVLPITYAADAFRAITIKGFGLEAVIPDLIILTAFALVMIALSLMLFKRELV